ncbi:MAG: TetR family transcriptional regulator [Sneathiella sp.]
MRERPGRRQGGKGRQRQSAETRKLILSAAARQFRDKGYAASTLKEIGAAAGIEAASLYYYFESKEDILEDVLDLGFRQALEVVSAIYRDCVARRAGFRETFRAMIHAHLRCILIEGDFAAASMRNFSTLPGAVRIRHRPSFHAYGDLWLALLTNARESSDVRDDIDLSSLQRLIVGALNWTVEWFDAKNYSLSDFSEKTAGLLLDGMLYPTADPARWKDMPALVDPVLRNERGRTKAERTRAHIIFSAARVLCDRGYEESTLRQIAERAGLEAGSLYYHFSSKEEIIDAVLAQGLREITDGVGAILESDTGFPDHGSRLAAGIRSHMLYLYTHDEFVSTNIRIYGQLPRDISLRQRPVRQEYAAVWERSLRRAQAAGELRAELEVVPLRQLMLGALNWTVLWFDPERKKTQNFKTLDELIGVQRALFLEGIVARRLAGLPEKQ